jgi:hypothetical protein
MRRFRRILLQPILVLGHGQHLDGAAEEGTRVDAIHWGSVRRGCLRAWEPSCSRLPMFP